MCSGCDLVEVILRFNFLKVVHLEFESLYWAKDLELTDMGSPPIHM
jgi:hypothetical protein